MDHSSEPQTIVDFFIERAEAHREMGERCADATDRSLHLKIEKHFRELAAIKAIVRRS